MRSQGKAAWSAADATLLFMSDPAKTDASLQLIAAPAVQKRILVVRERQVMLDEDLADSAACVHEVIDFCREGDIRFSVGHDITAPVREAIAAMPEEVWVGAVSQDGAPVAEHPTRPREAYVTELTEHLDSPPGRRARG